MHVDFTWTVCLRVTSNQNWGQIHKPVFQLQIQILSLYITTNTNTFIMNVFEIQIQIQIPCLYLNTYQNTFLASDLTSKL